MELCLVATMLVTSIMMAWYYIKAKGENNNAPVNWPVIGMLPAVLRNMSNIYEYGAKVIIDNGGTFRFRGPWMSKDLFEVVTSTPVNIEYILKTDFRNFPRGPYYREVFYDIFEDGLFNADDDIWKRQRKAVAAALANRETYLSLFKALVQEKLIPVLEQAEQKKYPLDFQDLFLRLHFDNMSIPLLGKDPQSLSLDLPDVPFPTAFSAAVEACPYRMIFPTFLWKLMKLMNIGFERKISKAEGIIDECLSESIGSRVEELKNITAFPHGDSLTNFMKLEADNGHSTSQKTLQGLCMSLILAGRDTSAVSLSWFFWLINMHPEVEEKILSEVSMVSKTSELECEYFGAMELANLNYLQAALSEAMRLYPPVPIIYRQAIKDNVLPDGTLVKQGSNLLVFTYATSRMESVWGKDAREFRPERWINKDGVYVKEGEYKYPVFNAGPRLCLGREIAYMTMKYVVANILGRYRVNVVAGHPVKPKFGVTLFMKHGLMVTLHSREVV